MPLQLAYAVTIHKSQCLTLPKIAVGIGPKELLFGALILYLVLEDILLEVPLTRKSLTKFLKNGAYADRLTFENYLRKCRLNYYLNMKI